MVSKKILTFIILILVLVLTFVFLNNLNSEKENIDLNKRFGIPKDTFVDSAYAAVLYNEDLAVKHNINQINTLDEKKKFDKETKEKILDLLNMPLPEQKKVDVVNIETVDKGKYIQQKILIKTSPITRAEGYLLIPKNLKSPAPAIMAMHGHGNNYYGKEWVVGNIGPSDSYYGKELAERGYVVLATDSPLFGLDEDNSTKRNSRKVTEELAAQALFSLGIPLLGVVVQEDLDSLNYLYSLDFVDKNRIGCIGYSFGGTRCNYLAALDDRIKVVALADSVAYLVSKRIVSRTWFAILPGIAQFTGKKGLLALIAPRPQIIVFSENDPSFPVQEANDIIIDLAHLYERIGYKKNIETIYLPNETHSFPPQAREQVYNFFDRHLKNNS